MVRVRVIRAIRVNPNHNSPHDNLWLLDSTNMYVDQYMVDFNAREDEIINSNFSSMQALLEGSQTFYAGDNNTTLSRIFYRDIRNDPPIENNEQSIIDKIM